MDVSEGSRERERGNEGREMSIRIEESSSHHHGNILSALNS